MENLALVVGVIAIISACIRLLSTASDPGKQLNEKFLSIGRFTDKNKNDFIKVVGSPNSFINNPDDSQSCTWAQGWYSITLLFDKEGKFIKILSEKLR